MTPGTVIARRFEVQGLAGQGGMGAVYRARDLADGATVALKVLRDGDTADAERFGREATALAEVRHPGIVRYIAHGITPDGRPYLAMEWLAGEDLGTRLSRGALALEGCVTIGRRVGDALSAAHARGIIHRDIKPSNLFLPGGLVEEVKVVDFGIARMMGWSPAPHTRPGIVMGTPGYMAPEQARGDGVIDARADVFALGCVLHECMTGRVAFSGELILAVLAKILFSPAPNVKDLRPEAPDDLVDLVQRMLHKDPAQRPASGTEVAAAFARLDASGAARESLRGVDAPRAITGGAQRLVSLVLAEGVLTRARPGASDADAPTAADLPGTLAASGGELQSLANGGLVIVFRGEGAATDLAEQAARCALDLSVWAPHATIAVSTGLGDLTGPGVVGEAIDRGVRLLHERPAAGVIRVDASTAGLLGPRFEVDPSGMLVRESAFEDAPRTLRGRATPCVGRNREVAMTVSVFETCVTEPESRAVVITGAAGVGKSRVRQEVLTAVRERWPAVRIVHGRGDRTRAGSRLTILADAVRRACRLREGDPLVVQRRVLMTRIEKSVPGADAGQVTEFLGELIGVPFSDEGSVQLRAARADPRLMGDQMELAWTRFLGMECRHGPVVLVLEDLQWADRPTIRFVDAALRALSHLPFFVLAMARPEVDSLAPVLWPERRVDRISLTALGSKASERLVREVLGPDLPAETVAQIVERAEGNAFFLEQLIHAYAEGGSAGAPSSILAMLQSRLDALPAEHRRTLRAASVFGRFFWRGGVGVLLGELAPEPALGRWLGELAERELLTRSRSDRYPQQEEWAFRHDLLAEAAYASLPEGDRSLGHRMAAEWLEGVGARDALALADHFQRGGEEARAVRWYVDAAEGALQANDLEGARAHGERAVMCGASGETLGIVRAMEAEICRWRSDNERGVVAGREALRLLPKTSPRWYLAAGQLGSLLGRTLQLDTLEALGRELLETTAPGAVGPRAVAAARTAISLLFAGRYEIGEALLASIEASVSEAAGRDPAVAAWIHMVRATRAQFAGDVGALAAEEHAAAVAFEAAGNLRSSLEERSHEGFACVLLGAFERAEAVLRATALDAERLGLLIVGFNAKHNLGLALALQGKVDEGLAVELEALEGHLPSYGRGLAACKIYAARILVMKGDLEEAGAQAREAIALLEEVPPTQAAAHAVLARVLMDQGQPVEALDHASRAHALLERLGGLDEGEAYVRLVYAEALLATGAEALGREVLARARGHLLETAAKIGDEAMREQFLRRVPENARILALT